MPVPRATTAVTKAGAIGTTTFSSGGAGWILKAVIVGKVSDQNNTYYLNLNGSIVRAEASIDAPLDVGHTVWVGPGPTKGTYVIQGTGA